MKFAIAKIVFVAILCGLSGWGVPWSMPLCFVAGWMSADRLLEQLGLR